VAQAMPIKSKTKNRMKHQLTGKVVSDKMQKTVVVLVERLKKHPKYQKRYKVSKRYKAHDENKEYKLGDVVVIEDCRPVSKDKKWKVVKKISTAAIGGAAEDPVQKEKP
jgi:small subunit ribosomal protein S17